MLQNVKGTSDFWGAKQTLRKKVQTDLERLFGLYDFEPMETPVLNEQSLMASKYAGGDEILKEMYTLTDQGNRTLALRYDLTIPFAKVAAMYPGLERPFKRYEIGKVYRDGPVKRGRLREFTQCDADVIGVDGPEAEAELMQLAADAFKLWGIDIVIRWNNRLFLSGLLERIGVPSESMASIMLTLDKLAKIGLSGVRDELVEKGLAPNSTEALIELIEMQNASFRDVVAKYGLDGSQGALEVEALESILAQTGLGRICRFDPFLSRGLSFYTGTVYEIFDVTGAYTSSLGGGGRYDRIIGKLVGSEERDDAAVGLSFGIEPITELLKERGAVRLQQAVRIMPIGSTISEALIAAAKLREAGIRTRVDGGGRKLKNRLATAASSGARFVMLIGEEEARLGVVRLKDLLEKTEQELAVEDAASIILETTLT